MRRFLSRFAHRVNAIISHPQTTALMVVVCAVLVLWGVETRFSSVWGVALGAVSGIFACVVLPPMSHANDVSLRALHVKVDELLVRFEATRNEIVGLEDAEEATIRQAQRDLRDEIADVKTTL